MSSPRRREFPVSRSQTEMTEIVMPNDANPLGNLMGGRLMHFIDMVAAVAAGRHARGPVVTASVDRLDFHHPVVVGSVLVLKASVNFAGTTSMEVGVKCWAEDRSSLSRYHVASAYLTFVALDASTGRPTHVPRLQAKTAEQKRRFDDGQRRRKSRLAERA
ncbi:MAG: acyl-CoA thioesterase [Planctomycetota bacterium]